MSKNEPRVEVHLSQSETYTSDPLVDAAYDQAMDSLTQSQRNEILADVSRKRAEAKIMTQRGPGSSTPQVQKRTEPLGFWKRLLWILIMFFAWSCIAIGWLYTTVGQLLRKWGESLR